jgi:hypothetical protein
MSAVQCLLSLSVAIGHWLIKVQLCLSFERDSLSVNHARNLVAKALICALTGTGISTVS